jgi:hygromycin-B 7''-O-kinase
LPNSSLLSTGALCQERSHAFEAGDRTSSHIRVGFWWPYVAEILERHDLAAAAREPVAGFNATWPTFVYGDVVVKLFGSSPRSWRASHAAERAAQDMFATGPEIAAPSLLGEGRLYDDVEAPWPYLVTTPMSGVASWRAELSI